jgi:biotin carboxylase
MSPRLLICGIGAGVELVIVTASATRRVAAAASRIVIADPADPAAVEAAVGRSGIAGVDGVLSLGFDNPPTCARLCRRFGCPGLDERVARDCTRKDLRLARLAAAGLPTPRFAVVHEPGDAIAAVRHVGLPAIVKPVDLTGSLGVCTAGSTEAVATAIAVARGLGRAPIAVVEQFLHGTEHTVAGFCVAGRIDITGFSDRAYPRKEAFAPFIFEDGDTLPSRLDAATRRRVEHEVERGVRALDLDPAFFNTDVLVTASGEVFLLEVTGRLTGARIATEVVPLATGVDPLPNAVRLALGQPIERAELVPDRDLAVVQRYVPATPGRIEWVGDLDAVDRPRGVYDLFWGMDLAPGMELAGYRSSDDVIAGVIAVAPTAGTAEHIAAEALRRIPLRMAAPC